jgi:hypothetical protein
MVATAQRTDRAVDARGPRATGGGWQGNARPNKRTLNQNDLIHKLIREAVKAGFADDHGRCLDFYDAKTVLVTAFDIAKGLESEIVIYDGRPIQLRRSTTAFDKSEASEFAEFIHAECAQRGIDLGGSTK